ncbi:hexose carrier protein HEX6 [Vigna angularis]|uniref:hexose carrier protein HEX6 n=1 Tax=Phaseolus angularis TaxID=3914 RepID=UPI0022B5B187|nr:hexose carrier protein HEX6 [Vigna angularis]
MASSSSRCGMKAAQVVRNVSPNGWISDDEARYKFGYYRKLFKVVPHKFLDLELFRKVFYHNLKVVNGVICSRVKDVDIEIDDEIGLSFTSLKVEGFMAHEKNSELNQWTNKKKIYKKFVRYPKRLKAVPLYLSEMALPQLRGATSNGFQLSICIGGLFATLINYGIEKIDGGWGWCVSLAMAGVPASILTFGALFLPETPNNLIQRGHDHQKAKLLLQRIRGIEDVQAELDDLIKASSSKANNKQSFKVILKRRYRPQLVMAVAIPFFQQMTGINVIGFYGPLLFRTIGLGE